MEDSQKGLEEFLSDHRVIYITVVVITSTTGSLQFNLSFHPYMFM